MKKPSVFIFLAALALSAVPFADLAADGGSGAASAEATWSTDFAASLKQARAENKRILIDFSGSDWCYWCQKMDADVLSKQEFKDYAAKHLVLVLADRPRDKTLPPETEAQNRKLARKFDIDGFPTFIVLDKDGNELDRRSGYVRGGPENFIRFLKVTERKEESATNAH
jgi:protein disulfide-isomerase